MNLEVFKRWNECLPEIRAKVNALKDIEDDVKNAKYYLDALEELSLSQSFFFSPSSSENSQQQFFSMEAIQIS
jgi:hypothetical protein